VTAVVMRIGGLRPDGSGLPRRCCRCGGL